MNQEQQAILQNFVNLEEDLQESSFESDFKILRQAWNIEIKKPGCTQCIKNGAKNKYTQIASNMILHNFSIEDSKKVLDKRNELNKKHNEVAKEIENEIQATIKQIKGEEVNPNKSIIESLIGESLEENNASGESLEENNASGEKENSPPPIPPQKKEDVNPFA
ncbi:hypothetical protein OAA62_00240 [bacterium]|nr:hypothetical protein [bacterium]